MPTGVLPQFPITMLDQLRKLGLVVEVDDAKVVLRNPFCCAQKGVPLTPEQAKILAHLDRRCITFKVDLLYLWTDGQFEEL